MTQLKKKTKINYVYCIKILHTNRSLKAIKNQFLQNYELYGNYS